MIYWWYTTVFGLNYARIHASSLVTTLCLETVDRVSLRF